MSKQRIFWGLWALVPVVAGAWWFGPAEELRAQDAANAAFDQVLEAERQQDWDAMERSLAAVRKDLPPESKQAERRIEFAEARLAIQQGDMWGGVASLQGLLEDSKDDPSFAREVRDQLGRELYHAAWLMRLEGGEADQWRPVALESRQHFRLLAESATDVTAADEAKRNVEAVIQLEKLDLSDLIGVPLPSNCSCNCNGLCNSKKRKRSSPKDKKPGKKDGRKKMNGAGQGSFKGSGT